MINEDKYLYHVTMVTHNSRINERMKHLKIKVDKPVFLVSNEEIELVNQITNIVKKNHYEIRSFNICGDHVHFVIFCLFHELENIIRNIKTNPSRSYRKKNHKNLWAQKFNRKVIEDEDQLFNIISYIQTNRIKHGLPSSEKLEKAINKMITPFENKG